MPSPQYGQRTNVSTDDSDKVTIHTDYPLNARGTTTKRLAVNIVSGACNQGQTHGNEGFLLTPSDAIAFLNDSPRNIDVIFPFMTMADFVSNNPPLPQRYVIDFHPKNVVEASTYIGPFKYIKERVLEAREIEARKEEERNKVAKQSDKKIKVNVHHRNFLKKWWLLSWAREDLINRISTLPRYIVCGQLTKRPIFEFVHPSIRPNAALQVFSLPDDYSFGILQSGIHWLWFTERCSTFKADWRYTSDSVFDTFPWPQTPSLAQIANVAKRAIALRDLRRSLIKDHELSLRELYRTLELPGSNPLKDAQDALDTAVRTAYGMTAREDILSFLLKLNNQLAEREEANQPVVGPGLPSFINDSTKFITVDCIEMPTL